MNVVWCRKRPAYLPLGLLGFWLTAVGCQGDPAVTLTDQVERAKAVTRLRREAESALGRWETTGKYEWLEEYANKLGETTKVAPTGCPRCYRDYAVALRRLGRYHWMEKDAIDQKIRAKEGDLQQLKGEREALIKTTLDFFAKSNQNFERYYQMEGGAVEPWVYDFAARQYHALEDYRRAIFFVDRLVENVELTVAQARDIKSYRKRLRSLQRRKEERIIDQDLQQLGDTDFEPQPGN